MLWKGRKRREGWGKGMGRDKDGLGTTPSARLSQIES